jgi:hypothetical protein
MVNKIIDALRRLLIAFFGGAILLLLLSAGGEIVDKYIYTQPLWVVWIAYLVTGGIIYFMVDAYRGKFE